MNLRDQLDSALGGTYTIERELGGGGMSRVFSATETALGRKVVIKFVPVDGILQAPWICFADRSSRIPAR